MKQIESRESGPQHTGFDYNSCGETMSIDDVFSLASELPQPERAALAHRLLLSLEPEDFDPDSEAAWAAEVEARLATVERDDFTASDWRDAVARMRQKLSQGRSP